MALKRSLKEQLKSIICETVILGGYSLQTVNYNHCQISIQTFSVLSESTRTTRKARSLESAINEETCCLSLITELQQSSSPSCALPRQRWGGWRSEDGVSQTMSQELNKQGNQQSCEIKGKVRWRVDSNLSPRHGVISPFWLGKKVNGLYPSKFYIPISLKVLLEWLTQFNSIQFKG